MNSSIHDATVRHIRHTPREHEFSYRVPVFVFDLAELESGALDGPLFGHDRSRLVSLWDRDYLHEGPGTIREKLARALADGGLDPNLAGKDVRLVTSARFLGYVFNPVSFYYLYDGEHLGATVAEVNNTFGEKHLYVLGPADAENGAGDPARFRHVKEFHVSPFNDMAGEYAFRFADARSELDVSIDLEKRGETFLEARLWAEEPGKPVTSRTLLTYLAHPHRVLTFPRILREAARLYFRRRLTVYSKPHPASPMTIRTKAAADRPGPLGRLARRLFFKILANARYGRLRLTLPDGRTEIIQGETEGPHVELRIADARFFTALARSGDIGFGEAYTEGWWTSPDLPELLRFFVLNREAMRFSRAVAVPQPIVSLYRGLRRLGGRRNHKNGARENIRRHYDLGDDLFHTFLDPSMAYSSAVFEREDMSLAEAQRAKFRKIAEKANLKPGDRVLEIGCGWGGFAAYAAEHHGCHVTGLTISDHQHEHARALAAEKGLQELMDIRKMDYRDVEGAGAYDAIVSIEMLEAVGHEYHETFYETLERLLAPDGVAVVQVIVIRDQRYNAYRFEGDWSRKHIFPGGLLPSLTRLAEVMRSRSTLMVRDIEAIGPHYARTLAEWRKRFLTAADVLEEHGYDERFRRTWDYYFAYCQAGFACRVIDDYQIVMDRPQGVGIRT